MVVKQNVINFYYLTKITSKCYKKNLEHLGLWDELPHNIHSPPLPEQRVDQITYEPFFDELPYDEQQELFRAMG